MNAFPDSTGDGLTFRVIGEDTTIDPATGEVSVSTEALRDGIEIVVTATNSGGEASSRFRLTVAASTMGSAPALVTAPSLAGSGLVGEALSVDAGVWAGEPLPDIALQWRCGGVDLPGATAASYLPGAAEDGKPVTCRVTAANASGSLSAETAETIVTRPAPQVAGGLADVSHVQGSGPQGVDAGAVFTGGGLVFSVEGGGATIDPATGQVTLPTDALRDGETVRVVASNSGGSAEAAFAVTVAAKVQAFPAPVPDDLWRSREVRDEAPAGRRRIDVDAGVIVPTGFTLIWLSGRTSDADLRYYTPVIPGKTETTKGGFPVGTALHDMIYWRRDEDGAFSPAFVTQTQYVVRGLHPKPALVDPVADRTAVQGDPAIVLDASRAFYPDGDTEGATFSVTGTGASIDAATGIVTISTAALRSDDPVTVTATTVSGSTDDVFRVSITAKTAPFPPDVADARWADGEERDAAPEGRMTVLVDGDVAIPDGFTLCWSPTENPNGVPEWSVPQTPGTGYTTNSTSDVGTTIHSMLFWRRDEDGAYQLASGKRTHVLQGLLKPTPPGPIDPNIPLIATKAVNVALATNAFVITDTESYAMKTNYGVYGPLNTILGLRRMYGPNSDVENKIKTQIDTTLQGTKGPVLITGYSLQHDLQPLALFSLVRNIPDLWNSSWMNSSNRKEKITALMEAALYAGAWGCSDATTLKTGSGGSGGNQIWDLRGYSAYQRTWNANFRVAAPGCIMICIPFFGGASIVKTMLQNYNHTGPNSVKSRLSSYGLTNASTTYNTIGKGGKIATVAEFEKASNQFEYYGRQVTDIFGIAREEADAAWDNIIESGLDGGAGRLFTKNGKTERRGLMTSGAGSLPNKGIRAMANEFKSSDSGGVRSSMSYVITGMRTELLYLSVLAATGYLTSDIPGMDAFILRFKRGWIDIEAKNAGGYKSWAKGGSGNSENWTASLGESNFRVSAAFGLRDFILDALTPA